MSQPNNDAANAILAEALASERRGDTRDARGYYKHIVDEFPGTRAAEQAARWLGATPPPIVAAPPEAPAVQRVAVVDFDVSFGSLVWLFVKASIALIPAAIILGAIGFVLFVAFAGFVSTVR